MITFVILTNKKGESIVIHDGEKYSLEEFQIYLNNLKTVEKILK